MTAKRIKKYAFPGITLITSFYFSIIFLISLIAGYISAYIFDKKFIQTKKIKLVIFSFGKWRFHLHHWLSGSAVLILSYIIDISKSPIYFGILGGIIFHDLYTDKEWKKVIYREN